MALPGELAVADLVWSLDGKEIAVNRIWMRHQHNSTVSFSWGGALQTIADKVVSSLDTGGAGHGVLSHVNAFCYLSRVDAYQIGTDGHATDKRTHSLDAGDVAGTASGNWLPILSGVVQLWGYDPAGFVAHARRRRGRLFAPATPSSYFSADGEMTETTAGNMASSWAAFMNDLQGMHVGDTPGPGPTDSMDVGILSRTDQAFYQMEAVTVAYKPGIQKRRMKSLPTSRSAASAVSHS